MSAIGFAPASAVAESWAATASVRPVDMPGLDDDAVVRLLIEVEAAGRHLDAVRAALAGEASERSRRELGGNGLAQRLGCRNAVELVQRTTGASAATVNRRIRVGRATRASTTLTGVALPPRFEAVAAALKAGTLPYDSACAIVDVLSPALRVAAAQEVRAAEGELVAGCVAATSDGAPPVDADCVRLQAMVWHTVLDPDGATPDERDVERRCLRLLGVRHGLVPVTGMLLPEVAASLRQYADACTNPRSADLPSAVQDGAQPTTTPPGEQPGDQRSDRPRDQRSRVQQLHDVLATIIGVAARAADAPSVAGNAPTLVVSVRAEDLVSGRGAAFADGAPPLSIDAARHVGCAGAVQRVVMGCNGRIVGLGAPERCFTGLQRRGIALRDGGCVIPGCHVPAGWCEVHHVTPHSHDPDGTHTDNGVLLCWFHHRTIDTAGWQIRMLGGVPQIKPPPWLDRGGGWRRAIGSPARIADRGASAAAGQRCA
jgi:5-methylcytosine-specific restriction protein A